MVDLWGATTTTTQASQGTAGIQGQGNQFGVGSVALVHNCLGERHFCKTPDLKGGNCCPNFCLNLVEFGGRLLFRKRRTLRDTISASATTSTKATDECIEHIFISPLSKFERFWPSGSRDIAILVGHKSSEQPVKQTVTTCVT